MPIVGTWREDDPTVPAPTLDWFARVRRLPAVDELALRPLTRDGTAEQLALLTGEVPTRRRSTGSTAGARVSRCSPSSSPPRPATTSRCPTSSPTCSTGASTASTSRRGGSPARSGWRTALADGLLSDVTTLASADLAAGLHELADRRLLHPAGDQDVQLRHPLLAEAVRRRLVRPESVDEHRRIAAALAGAADPAPREVAEHWQRAEDPGEEIVWRIRAARAAGRRFASSQEGEQWLRVLELWPEATSDEAGVPPMTRADAYLAAMDALKSALQFDRAADLCDEATRRLTNVDAADRAALLVRAADFRGQRESAEVGLELIEQALEIYATLPPSAGYVQALDRQHNLLVLGRFDDAYRVAKSAVEAAEKVGDPRQHRRMLAWLAWHQAEAGDVARGLHTAAEANALVAPGTDPQGDMRIGVICTDILLRSGGSAEEVEAAGKPGLAVAAESGIDSWQGVLLRSNISEALTRAGFVGRAAA